jgi:hypothetical protein
MPIIKRTFKLLPCTAHSAPSTPHSHSGHSITPTKTQNSKLANVIQINFPFIHPFIHSFIHPFIHSFIHPFIHSFIHPFIHSSIHSFIHSFIHPFIHSSIHSFIHPFIHSFIHTSTQTKRTSTSHLISSSKSNII